MSKNRLHIGPTYPIENKTIFNILSWIVQEYCLNQI